MIQLIVPIILIGVLCGFAGYFFREHLYKKNRPKVIINADLIKSDGRQPIFECQEGQVDVLIRANVIECDSSVFTDKLK